MNCQQCQKKICDSLAAGESRLAIEVAAHENSCEACGQFHAAQLELFRSLEIGLRSLVNAPVPVSLLPSVRARLDQESVSHPAAMPHWSFVAVTLVAILVVSAAYTFRHPPKRFSLPQTIATATPQSAGNPETSTTPLRESPTLFPQPASTRVVRAKPSAAAQRIIVPPEERHAFTKLITALPQQRNLAMALGQPAPPSTDTPIEIALVRIDVLDLEPLETPAKELQ